MTFPEFLAKWNAGTLNTDAAWRGYDIPGSIKPNHATRTLKMLGLTYAGELALPEACARYDMDIEAAPRILACFYLWSMIDQGRGGYWRVAKRKKAG